MMAAISKKSHEIKMATCPSCGHQFQDENQASSSSSSRVEIDMPGLLPAGVKFDPTDQELLQHLESKASLDPARLDPLIDEFIPTIHGEGGICYTHPQRLPGVSMDGLVRHFFHRPSKAYTTGTRKRRKVHTDALGGEMRWHKTGKTRPVFSSGSGGGGGGKPKGFKKILVLYTNYGKRRKPEKTSWVMHQYHLGSDEEEKDGDLVVSKVFYQTQPRQSTAARDDAFGATAAAKLKAVAEEEEEEEEEDGRTSVSDVRDYYTQQQQHHHPALAVYDQSAAHLMPGLGLRGGATPFLS